MATVADVKTAVAETGNGQLQRQDRLETILGQINVKKRFEEILGAKSAGFVSSILSAVNTNPSLKTADPKTVLSAAVVAATLDLPINASLGYAYIVPYKGRAQFQIGWKGFVQLGLRTAQYRTMNSSEVFADELKSWNQITGELTLTEQSVWRDRYTTDARPIGYAAYFKLLNGFEKYLYMTTSEVRKHAQRYSQSYANENSQWQKNFDAMARKTLLKLLLSKFGILSIEMQKAIQVDQAVVSTTASGEEQIEYPDGETDGIISVSEDDVEIPQEVKK
jgi:recombination protein RecT